MEVMERRKKKNHIYRLKFPWWRFEAISARGRRFDSNFIDKAVFGKLWAKLHMWVLTGDRNASPISSCSMPWELRTSESAAGTAKTSS